MPAVLRRRMEQKTGDLIRAAKAAAKIEKAS
jgi:hypothetical protein